MPLIVLLLFCKNGSFFFSRIRNSKIKCNHWQTQVKHGRKVNIISWEKKTPFITNILSTFKLIPKNFEFNNYEIVFCENISRYIYMQLKSDLKSSLICSLEEAVQWLSTLASACENIFFLYMHVYYRKLIQSLHAFKLFVVWFAIFK